MERKIVFFDDVCVLCSRSVQFIFRHDRQKRLFFASTGSEPFRQIVHLLPHHLHAVFTQASSGEPLRSDHADPVADQHPAGEFLRSDHADPAADQHPAGEFLRSDYADPAADQHLSGETLRSDQPPAPGSVIFYDGGRIYTRSTAVLRIAAHLRFPLPLLTIGFIIPPFIRDGIYDWIARNRYRWFGKRETCFLPDTPLRQQFLP
jgi:predicted DCC family thiol-disulfide oxidoreductase YuxK